MSRRNETVWRKPCTIRMPPWAAASGGGRHRGRALAGLAIIGLLVTVPSESVFATAARRAPRLGRPWGTDQIGYGTVRPTHIFNGGDPTGEMQHIHWTGWGSRQAIGEGDAEYVWPGTSVASNGDTSGARVVAFHLGTCRGQPSYNAIEWYFPKYGQSFNPHAYINICTGKYVGYNPPETECPDVRLADGGMATEVKAINMTCPAASTIIAETNTKKFGTREGRFMQAGFRCGTGGTGGGLPNALFDCQMGEQEFLFWGPVITRRSTSRFR